MIGLNPSISHDDFLKATDGILTANNLRSLVERCQELIVFQYGSYHHIPAIGTRNYNQLNRYWAIGLDDQVLDYLDTRGQKSDPVMSFVFEKARPFWLSDLSGSSELTGDYNQSRIKLVLDYVGDGMLAPLFGPFDRRGYMFVGFKQPKDFYDDIFLWQFQAILQAIHIHYCKLVESLRNQVKLTKRESEVLELITFGKTNPEIGTALGISTNTVSGYVKKLFLKFEATDRVTVALRARSSIL